jgi:hypothetical protein
VFPIAAGGGRGEHESPESFSGRAPKLTPARIQETQLSTPRAPRRHRSRRGYMDVLCLFQHPGTDLFRAGDRIPRAGNYGKPRSKMERNAPIASSACRSQRQTNPGARNAEIGCLGTAQLRIKNKEAATPHGHRALDLVVLPARQVGEEAVKGEHSQMLEIKFLKAKRGVGGGPPL